MTTLAARGEIRRRHRAGPMPLGDYMGLCLTHPQHGYYINRDPLGAAAISSPRRKSARCSAN